MLSDREVSALGERGWFVRDGFLGEAAALLFPIDWPEPFGLVMIEAMACGTPVVAWEGGSVREVIDPGVTGFVVDSMDDAVRATREAVRLDRRRSRRRFEARFSQTRMAREYLAVYERLAAGSVLQSVA